MRILFVSVIVLFTLRPAFGEPKNLEREIVARLRRELPSLLCGNGQYFMTCTRLTAASCKSKVGTGLEKCASRIRMTSREPASAENFAFKVGRCVGGLLKSLIAPAPDKRSACAEAGQWR
jgi:hypothetical protein